MKRRLCLLALFVSIFFPAQGLRAEEPQIQQFPFYVTTQDTTAAASRHLSENGAPLPPRRPKVMNVSPSYIEELKRRNAPPDSVRTQEDSNVPEVEPPDILDEKKDDTALSALLPLPEEIFAPFDEKSLDPAFLDKEPITQISIDEDIAQEKPSPPLFAAAAPEIFAAPEQEKVRGVPPVPPPLPEQRVLQIAGNEEFSLQDELARQLRDADRMAVLRALEVSALVPAAGNMENKSSYKNETIVSFALQPEQIKIDPAIEAFLRDHALDMFQKDKRLKMEIQSYATVVERDEHSPMRISLARALEIRRF